MWPDDESSKKDHCQLTYRPGSQDAIATKNEMIYNLLYLYVLRKKIRLDRTLLLLIRCLVVILYVSRWQWQYARKLARKGQNKLLLWKAHKFLYIDRLVLTFHHTSYKANPHFVFNSIETTSLFIRYSTIPYLLQQNLTRTYHIILNILCWY